MMAPEQIRAIVDEQLAAHRVEGADRRDDVRARARACAINVAMAVDSYASDLEDRLAEHGVSSFTLVRTPSQSYERRWLAGERGLRGWGASPVDAMAALLEAAIAEGERLDALDDEGGDLEDRLDRALEAADHEAAFGGRAGR